MELIKGYLKTIKVAIPATATALTASVKDTAGAVVVSGLDIDFENGIAEILLPYSVVSEERTLKLYVGFTVGGENYDKTYSLNVATPYLELHELFEILENDNEDQAWSVEAAVRHVINAHTGQSFGLTREPEKISGKGSSLGTTRPVIQLTSLSENGGLVYDSATGLGKDQYRIAGDGWYIKRPSWSEHMVRSDQTHYYSANPIRAPYFNNNEFKDNFEYIATGVFGYEEIPGPVREAAKLLVNDYACADALYRDRYLKSMRSADWRIEFDAGAWIATGNARADQLLNPYVVNRIVVI